LLLARDRSGVKPLYVRSIRGDIHFASEAKALLVDRDAPRRLDLQGYTGPAEIDAIWERTPFEGISQLGPGCLARISEGPPRARRYWTYAPGVDLHGSDADRLVRDFRRNLRSAVDEQRIADVPVGAYLSGGVDSSAIVALLARRSPGTLRTYTTASRTLGLDAEYAALCAARARVECPQFVPCVSGSELADLVPFVAWMAEGEFDSGYVNRYCLARAARRDGVKVILSGQGIDEILTGYCTSFHRFVLDRWRGTLAGRCAPSYRGLPPFSDRALAQLVMSDDPVWAAHDTALALREDHAALSHGLLRFEDRMGMAAGVEVRVPFLDHRLLELCASIPFPLRPDLLTQKAILRRAVRPWLPRSIADRPKFAFNASLMPITRLLECQPGGGHDLLWLLSSESILAKGYFDFPTVQELWRRRQYVLLDHVFVVQLLDELFVSRFDPDRFRGASPPVPASVPLRAPRRARYAMYSESRRAMPTEDTVPLLHPSVAKVRVVAVARPSGGGLEAPFRAVVDFVEAARSSVDIPMNFVAILQLVDGARSLRQIAHELQGGLPLDRVLCHALELAQLGVITSREGTSTLERGESAAETVRVCRGSHAPTQGTQCATTENHHGY
jgi:asparagine synthase (glutamine-hydrolysing)